MTSPRKRLSSQRKEEVCEEAGKEPLTYLRNSQRAGIFTRHHPDKTWELESEDNLMSALLSPEKSRSGAPPMLLPDFTPIRMSLRLCSAKKGKCDIVFALKQEIIFYSYCVILMWGDFVSAEILHFCETSPCPVSNMYRVSSETHTDWRRQQQKGTTSVTALNKIDRELHDSCQRSVCNLRVRLQRLTGESGVQVFSFGGIF